MREIARLAGIGVSSIQRELDSLTTAGILIETSRGNQRVFQANQACPLFTEIHGFAIKTFGIADLVRNAIAPLNPDFAFIFGSIAKGTDVSASDVDVMVIGDIDYRELLQCTGDLSTRIGRSVNAKFYKPLEFIKKLNEPDSFVARVVTEQNIFLVGDDSGIQALKSA
jgi:predicted nucleotidyltransferase